MKQTLVSILLCTLFTGPLMAEEALLAETPGLKADEELTGADLLNELESMDLDAPLGISYDPTAMSSDCGAAGLAIGKINLLKDCKKPSE